MCPTSRLIAGEHIRRAHDVAVAPEPAGRAVIGAPFGFVPVPTLRAGLGGKRVLNDRRHGDPRPFGFVCETAAHSPRRPGADFLLLCSGQPFAVGHVVYIADHEGPRLPFHRPLHHRSADLSMSHTRRRCCARKRFFRRCIHCQPRLCLVFLRLGRLQFTHPLGRILADST